MSRIGILPVPIPAGVEVSLDGSVCHVKGPKGELSENIHSLVTVVIEADVVTVSRLNDQKLARSLHGLTRTLIANMIEGVTQGYRKSVEFMGSGITPDLQGTTLIIEAGFSHKVPMEPLEGTSFTRDGNIVHVDGISKQRVGQQAALIRRVRPPSGYRAQGIKYTDEQPKYKAGKARTA
ncbi:MAG: 50S ribosomal protein L6 [Chloroflexota bacterium]|nr:50S ribosomal protein L6 [Chloroflexota bacterium]